MLDKLLPHFKVVEINNVSALRGGHVIAQTPAYVDGEAVSKFVTAKTVGEYKFVENGLIVGLDEEGVLANYDATRHAQPCLVYTEELVTSELILGLDQFAELVPGTGKPVYPRALPLNIGDTFTTDQYSGTLTESGFGKVVNGVITIVATREEGTMFITKKSDLPAGQAAVEVMYIGLPAAPANTAEGDGE